MVMSFEFSVVVDIDNCEPFIGKTMDFIVNQSLCFTKNVEIIFIYHKSSDGSLEIISEYCRKYPQNVKIIYENDFKHHITGKYATFLNVKNDYPEILLERVLKSFNENPDIDICYVDDVDSGIIDLSKYNGCIDFDMSRLFIRSHRIKNFNPWDYLEAKAFVYGDIFENPRIAVVNHRKISKSDMPIDLDGFNVFLKEMIEGYSPLNDFHQRYLLFEFQKFLKSQDSTMDLDILDHFDERAILSNESLENNIRSFIIYLKNREFHIDGVELKSAGHVINDLSKNIINIDFVEITQDKLNISGSLTSSSYPDDISIMAVQSFNGKAEKTYPAEYEYYPKSPRKNKRYQGIDWEFTYQFSISIPITDDEFHLEFRTLFNGQEISNHINFREFAGLSQQSNYSVKHSRILSFKGRTFHLENYSYPKMLKYELKSLVRIIKAHEDFFLTSVFYRIIYIVLFPYMKCKRIWLFSDRKGMAGDNGEYLFDYCIRQDDGIDKYFVIEKSAEDYGRLSDKYPNVIAFGSFKHNMMYLFSEKIMTSQVTRRILNPFTFKNSRLYEGVSSYDWCFLQHGVILHDLSAWIHKYNKNFYLFATSSDMERDSIINGSYNYDPERVQVLGLSRYDHLESDPERQIVFAPTWRRNLDTERDIINSDYLKSINSLLKNERLMDYAEAKGYRLVFKPHPDLWKFMGLIDSGFEISEDSYQQLFKSASLLVTDYSSVAFDFAYLKKPILYYQHDSFDEFHYDKGYFDYEKMGFGEVTLSEDDVVDKIIEYIDNGCRMEDKYQGRVDEFFNFHDRNNSKRIYEWLIYK